MHVATRFSQKVKAYLNAKFELGEKNGLKADPNQVSADMRNARDEENNRRFSREEWLTKSQIKSFFRLASARRKGQETEKVDDQTEIEDIFEEEEEDSRQQVISSIIEEIGLCHPICYDVYDRDLCDNYKCSKLSKFNVQMLKAILKNFEISYKSKDRKKI